MECHVCKTAELIALVRARYGKRIPINVRNAILESCITCAHRCRICKTKVMSEGGGEPVSVYRRKRQLRRQIERLTGKPEYLPVALRGYGRKTLNDPNAAPILLPEFSREDPLEVMRAKVELADILRGYCWSCIQTYDDNPTNRGETFISFEALQDVLCHSPDVQFTKWLRTKIRAEVQTTCGDNRSYLPPDVEDRIREQLAAFSGLSIVDKLFVSVLMTKKDRARSGYYNPTDFARLTWLRSPKVASSFAKWGIELRVTGTGLRRQSGQSRFQSLIRKMPAFAAIAAESRGKRNET